MRTFLRKIIRKATDGINAVVMQIISCPETGLLIIYQTLIHKFSKFKTKLKGLFTCKMTPKNHGNAQEINKYETRAI